MKINGTYGNTSKPEKIFYAFGDVGSGFIWNFSSYFLTLYYTDSALISAAFVGTMMLAARILDGVSDIAMGVVIEKTRTRWGKARPWLLFSVLPFGLSIILLFNVPSGFSESAKNIYVTATYIFMAVFCYTAVSLAYLSMLPRISLSQNDRNITGVVRNFIGVLFTLPMVNIIPMSIEKLGGAQSQYAWSVITGIIAVFAMVMIVICFLGTKEKLPLSTGNKDDSQRIPIKNSLKVLLKNRYFYIATFLAFCSAISSGVAGVAIYFVRDVLGNVNLFGILSIAVTIPIFLGLPVIPILFKKFTKRNVMRVGMLIFIAGNIARFFFIDNIPFYMGLTALCSLGNLPTMAALSLLPSDIVDFGEWKTGIRTEGIATSANSFGTKVGSGFGAALLGWGLALGHYQPSAVVQPASALNAMIFLTIGMPIILNSISFVLMTLWNMDKYQPQITEFMAKHVKGDENVR
jgi:GPH family glycoside/pentoside/hexuronide:cation symporter